MFIPGLYPNLTNYDLEEQVVTGYNGLDQYASRYWMSHVYEYMKEAGALDMTSCPELTKTLLKFASFRRDSRTKTLGSGVERHDSEEPCSETQSQNTVLALCSVPEVKNLLNCSLEFRQKLKDMESVLESPDREASFMILWTHKIHTCTVRSKWQHENDPTWLSDVEAQVATIIQRLLLLAKSTIPAHISVDQIRRFKTLYSSIGLHCRYSSCQPRCVTYGSENELRNHEFTHVRSYKCMECDFFERPFTSRQDLRKHQAKYHTASVDLAIPLQIRSLATKSLPPLRRKTQRLGIRESNVGLSPVDQPSPNDLHPPISNARIGAHQNPQTTREYVAKQKDLNLTDIPERNELETFNSADLVLTSCAEPGFAHKPEPVDKVKAVHFPNIISTSEPSFMIGEPMQTAPERSPDDSLRIDHIVESRHEPDTCNENPSKDIDVVHFENSTERILRFEDGHSDVESVESRVSRCVRLAAIVHRENCYYTGRLVDEEALRIKSLTQVDPAVGIQLERDAGLSCVGTICWSNLIGSYIDATFAIENAIPGISEADTEERLVRMICGIGENNPHAFLELRTRFLPQEMIRFERAMKLDGDTGTDLPTFMTNFRMWGPQHLKDYYERSMSVTSEYLDIEEEDIDDWFYNCIRPSLSHDSHLCDVTDGLFAQRWVRARRRDAHSELSKHILDLVDFYPVHVDDYNFYQYILSLLCKERKPTEMVKCLKKFFKSRK